MAGFRNIWGGEDPDLWLRLGVGFRFAYSASVQAVYHRGMPTQYSNLNLPMPYPPAVESIINLDKAGKIPTEMRNDVLEYGNRLLLYYAEYLIGIGCLGEARTVLVKCQNTKRYQQLWRWAWWRTFVSRRFVRWLHRLRH